MKLNLNTSSLNWEKANVFDYRYIYHLMLMINERYTKVGIHEKNTYYPAIPNEYANRQEWNFAKWSPNGILTWDQLQSIYSTTFFLAQYVYINPNNFNEEAFEKRSLKLFPGFSLQQLCEISNFDFFKNPFIPGQRLDYYNKFLLPLKKILAELKFIYTDAFVFSSEENLFKKFRIELPEKIVDGEAYTISGPDELEYLQNFENFKSSKTENYYSSDTLLGYQIGLQYVYDTWYRYNTGEEENYSGWKYTGAAFKDKLNLLTYAKYKSGVEFKSYLISTTSPKEMWISYSNGSNQIRPSYYKANYSNIILNSEDVISENGRAKITFSLDPINWNADITGIPIQEFYQFKRTIEDGRQDNVESKWMTYISCLFKPCIILNYGNIFEYF